MAVLAKDELGHDVEALDVLAPHHGHQLPLVNILAGFLVKAFRVQGSGCRVQGAGCGV